jgi:hypothetical protein
LPCARGAPARRGRPAGNADGTFRAPLVLTDPGLRLPQQQAVADYNGDGFQDLALSLGDGNQGLMQIRNGNGDGTFQAPVQYLVPPPTSSLGGIFIVSANLNGDTKPDIALNIGGAFPSFAVLLNSTGAAPPPTPSAPTLLSQAQDAEANDADPLLPTATLMPAGFEATRSPPRPVAVTVSVAVCG